MKKLDIKVIGIALGLAFSAGAMAQMSNDQDKPVKDGMGGLNLQAPATPSGNANTMGAPSDAPKDAQSAQRDRDYAAAKEKCDAMASSAKSDCMTEAKSRYGKT
ncbi:MAG TPA: hypothetical protein VFA36_04125 [Burkholderiales bacterium]|jgi:hypothetical protein|nr:hypothetical protein [Burkholderiales bacterium]